MDKSQSKPAHKDRVKARQQRRLDINPTKERIDSTGPSSSVRVFSDQLLRAEKLNTKRRLDKNDRRSRTGKGKGEPKKGGAGGKGTWGKAGMDDLYDEAYLDNNDPNYNSEDDENAVTLCRSEVLLNDSEAQKVIKDILIEFFEHADTDDVADSATDLNINGDQFYFFAKESVLLGLDSTTDANRELVSVLLSDLYGYRVLLASDIEKAFIELLNELDDIVLDCPDATVHVAQFIARCVADDCLPPKFIEAKVSDDKYSGKAKEALNRAHGLITKDRGLIALDDIWNSGEVRKPVKFLKKKMKIMLREYQESLDYENFVQSLHELGIPHFHHEIVYHIVLKCLEANAVYKTAHDNECAIGTKKCPVIESVLNLLNQLTSSAVVTSNEFEKGLKQVFGEIVGLAIDIPGAFKSVDAMCNRFDQEMGILTKELRSELTANAEKALKDAGYADLVAEKN